MKGINLEVLPQPAVNIILFLEIRLKIYKNRYRTARNIPTTDFNVNSVFKGFLFPIGKQVRVFFEIRTLLIAPAIWTNENDMILVFILQSFCAS